MHHLVLAIGIPNFLRVLMHAPRSAARGKLAMAGAAATATATLLAYGIYRRRMRASVAVREAARAEGFGPCVAAFRRAVGDHAGAATSVAVYKDGCRVLELYAGAATPSGRDFGPEHVTTVQSVSKVVAGLAIAMLEDRGLLSYDDPLQKHWPEFADPTVTVRELMSHTAGLHTLPAALTRPLSCFRDRDALGELLARAPRQRKGGGWFGERREHPIMYAAWTVGWFVSQLIRRVDPRGRYLREFCRDEIFAPLGIAADDASFGLTQAQFDAAMGRGRTESNRYCTHQRPALADVYSWMLPCFLQRLLFPGCPPARFPGLSFFSTWAFKLPWPWMLGPVRWIGFCPLSS